MKFSIERRSGRKVNPSDSVAIQRGVSSTIVNDDGVEIAQIHANLIEIDTIEQLMSLIKVNGGYDMKVSAGGWWRKAGLSDILQMDRIEILDEADG